MKKNLQVQLYIVLLGIFIVTVSSFLGQWIFDITLSRLISIDTSQGNAILISSTIAFALGGCSLIAAGLINVTLINIFNNKDSKK